MSGGESEKAFRIRLALACLPVALVWAVLTFTSYQPATLLEQIGSVSPVAFVVFVALAPLVGFPLAPLYVFAGLHYGWGDGYALAMVGIALNLLFAYPIYGALLRRHALSLLRRRGWDPERWQTANRIRATVLIASVPALPFWAQNAVLVCIGTPFRIYYPISIAVQSIFAAGSVTLGVLGGRALESSTLTLAFLLLIPVSMIMIRLVRRDRL